MPHAATLSADSYGTEFPCDRTITAHVSGGFDGALRVATMLRSRGYRVRGLSLDIQEGTVPSRFECTLELHAADVGLLLERLRRIVVVLAAEVH
jgi:tRNA U34 2-thiouridine synthase MnmA/TrmU